MSTKKYIKLTIIIASVIISFFSFGISLSFICSALFIIFVSTRILQDLDNKGLLDIVTLAGPFITDRISDTLFATFNCIEVQNAINNWLSNNHIQYIVMKKDIAAIIVYFFLVIMVMIFGNSDTTAIGKHILDGDPEFRKKTFQQKNDIFCKTLVQRIERINTDLNWNDSLYVPIAAEVEMTKGKDIKRYDDMLKCLKTNRQKSSSIIIKMAKSIRFSMLGKIRPINHFLTAIEKNECPEVYLVLGDPGSGKSVSLRKLCSDLLRESQLTGKTAVYISLKTWISKGKDWSDYNLPTRKDLIEYIKNELYKEGDLFTDDFLNNYFDKMLEDGRWYFIFDSFDEMPCLMGNNSNGILIKHISRLLYEFLSGPNQSGGVIASRMYNRPSDSLNQTCTLRLQKFSDARIRMMIKKYVAIDINDIIRDLFRDHPDLVGLCRNPFHLSLFINYIKKKNYNFPRSQYDLFKDFVDERLSRCKARINDEGLNYKDLYNAAIDLALTMQNHGGYGLEFPIRELINININSPNWEKYLTILEYIKICRFGGNRSTISFVHRRFQEFFFVEGIISNKVSIKEEDYVGILQNTGIRDALVLYCQIGEEQDIKPLIDFCFSSIEENTQYIATVLNENSAKLVNSLYFLSEAFCCRKDILREKLNIISGLRNYISIKTDYIILMAIANCVSLLDQNEMQLTLIDVFRLNNRWLNELVVSNCQMIKKLDRKIETWFCCYFEDNILTDFAIKNYSNIDFSLSLAEGFKYVRIVHSFMPIYLFIHIIFMAWSSIQLLFPLIPFIVRRMEVLFAHIKLAGFDLRDFIIYVGSLIMKADKISTLPFDTSSQTMIRTVMAIEIGLGMILVCILNEWRYRYGMVSMYKTQELQTKSIEADSQKTGKHSGNSYIKLAEEFVVHSVSMPDSFYRIVGIFVLLRVCAFLLVYNNPNKFEAIILFICLGIITLFDIYRIEHEVIAVIREYFYRNGLKKAVNSVMRKLPKIPNYLFSFVKDSIRIVAIMIPFAIIFLLVVYTIETIIPSIICRSLGIEISKQNLELVSNVCFLFAFLILIAVGSIVLTVLYTEELHRVKRINVVKLDRKDLVKNIKNIKFSSNRRVYIQELRRKEVKLEGEWKDGERIILRDDVLDRELALWDSKERSIETYYTNGE